MNEAISIGIIGGGAAAVCVLDALVRATAPQAGAEPVRPSRITVFEPGRNLWRGRPYQVDVPTVRVNIPPAGMSIRLSDSGHFERWLAATGTPAGPENPYYDEHCATTFVPRSLYGNYLEDCATEAIRQLRGRGWQVRVVLDRVVECRPGPHGSVLRTGSGHEFDIGYTVLCLGAGGPDDSYRLASNPRYIAEPYPLGQTLLAVEDCDSIAVIGTGLTAVDVVLSLAARGYQNKVLMLSRTGVLPAVRQRIRQHSLVHFTAQRFRAAARHGKQVSLAELVALMGEEVRAAGGSPELLAAEIGAISREEPTARLRRQLAEVAAEDPGLRILQHAVPMTGPDVWPLLSTHEQAEVIRSHYRTVMSLCCPMPASSGYRLLELLQAGQLELRPGLRSLAPAEDGGFLVRTVAGEHRVQAVVNAVNPSPHRVHPAAESLIDSLVRSGVTSRHPLGGITVTRATSGLVSGRSVSSRIYALGTIASGSLFFTYGMPSVVDRAHDIVHAVLAAAQSSVSLGLPATSAAV